MTGIRAQWYPGAAGPLLKREDNWRDRGRCAEVDPEIFYPGKGVPTAAAKAICRGCEVRFQCLDYALETGEQWGVWGGLSVQERSRLRGAAAVAVRDAAGQIRSWTEPAGETRRGAAAQRRNAA